jgi:aldose 1-epimerase
MYGTPILFPPNRVQGGSFTFKGRFYQLPINEQPDRHLHGELARRSWEVVERGGTEAQGAYVVLRFRCSDHEEMLAYFPHPLIFNVTISLLGGRLRLDGAIVNEGEDEAPFAFGLHPYFNLPSGQVLLHAPAASEWPISSFAFITGTPADTERAAELRTGLPLDRIAPLGAAMLELQEGEERVCRLQMLEEGYTIAYSFGDTFPYLLIFRPNWSESICLEPYTCLTDAYNLPYPPEMTGARGIAPGERVMFETCMWVE